MTKLDLAKALKEQLKKMNSDFDIPIYLIHEIIKEAFESIKESILEKNENVKISNFGTFYFKKRNEKRASSKRFGKNNIIAPYYTVFFKPSKYFVQKVNLNLKKQSNKPH